MHIIKWTGALGLSLLFAAIHATRSPGYSKIPFRDTKYFPGKLQNRGRGMIMFRVTGINKKTNGLIDKMRHERLSTHILTNIADVSKILKKPKDLKYPLHTKIEKIIKLRAICMLSNKVSVSLPKDRDLLRNTCGVPGKKLMVLSPNKKTVYKLSKPMVIKKVPVQDGLYVVLAGANIHINAQIKNKHISKIFVRAVREKPSTYPEERMLCRRGPYERRIEEEFAIITENNVFLSTTATEIFKAHKNNLKIQISGIEAEIDPRAMKIKIKTDQTFFKIGLASENNRKGWRIINDVNGFSVHHPKLTYSNNQMTSFLYNRPRRLPNEMFDPVNSKSPLKRVLISGWFNSSGMGDVSKRFLVEMTANQKLLIRSVCFDKKALCDTSEPDSLIPQMYLFESNQITKEKALYPDGKYASHGVEIRNSFPVRLHSMIQPYSKIFVHFPWEFSAIPNEWTAPIKSNRNMEIIVPSRFTRNVHRAYGMDKKRIHIIPHGVGFTAYRTMRNLEKKKKCLSIEKLFDVPKDHVRFVMIGGALKRKGIEIGINAYIKAFKNTDKVVLRIHTAYGDKEVWNDLRNIVSKNKLNKGPKIVYTEKYIENRKIRALLSLAHYNVSPFKGEGFGLCILDGNALGCVPIVTNAKPATEFCSKNSSFFIDCEVKDVQSYPVEKKKNGVFMFNYKMHRRPKWYEPSENHLARLLRRAYKIAHTKKYTKMRNECIKSAKKHGWRKHLRKLEKLILNS